MLKKYATVLLSSLLVLSTQSFAAITFTNGYWSTTFNGCSWTQPNALSCDGVEMSDGGYYADGEGSRINSAGNNPNGGGGSGFRMYVTGNVRNEISSPLTIRFLTPQTEFWVRFYHKLPAGQIMEDGPYAAYKILYLFGTNPVHVNWPYYDNIGLEGGLIDYVYGPGGDRSGATISYGDWGALYGGNPGSTGADGDWDCFEFYFKIGTTSSNGIFRMWVNGANVVNDTTANLGTGSFTHFDLPHNHNIFLLSGANPHDVDDIAVALPSYSGFTTNSTGHATGLTMIGPLSSGATPSTVIGAGVTTIGVGTTTITAQ